MPRTITIPSWQEGGTLSQIAKQYNTTVDELMRLNPTIKDPNKIQKGATLNIPELAGTLKTGGEETPKELPTIPADNLSLFRDLLKRVSERYGRTGMAVGMEAGIGTLGVQPEQISGRNLAGIVNFIKGQVTPGISDIYKTTVDLLDRQQKEADSHLQMMINTGAIANVDDAILTRLAESTHTPIDYLKQVREAKKKSAAEEGLSIEDAATYADMVLTGQLDLTSVPSGEGMRAEVGRMLSQIYQNPIANRIEVWKGKKEKFLEEGKESIYPDPGTREDLIREIKNALPDYSVDEIKEMVYALVPDVWEFNIQRRWRAKAGVTIINP